MKPTDPRRPVFRAFLFSGIILSFFLLQLTFSTPAQAQTSGVVIGRKANVRSEPSTKAEILHTYKKGQRVSVLEKRGKWVKVHVNLGDGFEFDGWIFHKLIRTKRTIARRSTTPALPQPSAATSSRNTMEARVLSSRRTTAYIQPDVVDLREEPSEKGKTVTRLERNQAVEVVGRRGAWMKVRVTKPGKRPVAGYVAKNEIGWRRGSALRKSSLSSLNYSRKPEKKEKKKETKSSYTPAASSSMLGDRLHLSAATGYLLYKYKLNTSGGGAVVDYSLSGMGIDIGAEYWFWQADGGKLRLGATAGYQRGFYFHKANLANSSGTIVGTEKTRSSSDQIGTRITFAYRFSPNANAIEAGFSGGFQYFKFNGEDITANGSPLLLFVSQQNLSILSGLYGQFPILSGMGLSARLFADILLLNYVSEDPSNASGTDAKGKIGIVPGFVLLWAPSSHHHFTLTYALHFQNFSFTGTASRVGTDNVTNGSAKLQRHTGLIGYRYQF